MNTEQEVNRGRDFFQFDEGVELQRSDTRTGRGFFPTGAGYEGEIWCFLVW